MFLLNWAPGQRATGQVRLAPRLGARPGRVLERGEGRGGPGEAEGGRAGRVQGAVGAARLRQGGLDRRGRQGIGDLISQVFRI